MHDGFNCLLDMEKEAYIYVRCVYECIGYDWYEVGAGGAKFC